MIKKVPVPICGLALGLAALGNLLLSYSETVRYICGGLSFVLLLLFILKLITNWQGFKTELENPVAFSVLPTFTMAIMLLSAYVKPFIGNAAKWIWFAALALQFIIIIGFVSKFVIKFDIKKVFPSWFIVGTGFVVASVTSPAMQMENLGRILFWAGFVLYLICLPVVIYRVAKVRNIPPPAQPTFAIFCAPVGLCLAGYMSAFEQKSPVMVYLLLALCLISYLAVIISMFKLLRLPFFPSFASFTFPLVISAIGMKMANVFLLANGIEWFAFVPVAATVIAVIVVLYVLIRYCVFLFSK